MKLLSNVHTHTTWCDGKNTPKEMLEAALALGFTDLGFSGHSPALFDPTCPGIVNEEGYREEIANLAKEYRGKIGVLCGVEQDFFAPVNPDHYDYIIGSVHYLADGDEKYVVIDGDLSILQNARDTLFHGNSNALARAFYELSALNVKIHRPDIVGHYDVITKYNKDGIIFDEDSKAYQHAALEPLEEILNTLKNYGGMVEVNTGAFAKGTRKTPYPAPFVMKYLAQKKARLIITGDSHSASALNAGFPEALEYVKEAGFTSLAVLKNRRFQDVLLS